MFIDRDFLYRSRTMMGVGSVKNDAPLMFIILKKRANRKLEKSIV